jgi:hypothetical protein
VSAGIEKGSQPLARFRDRVRMGDGNRVETLFGGTRQERVLQGSAAQKSRLT